MERSAHQPLERLRRGINRRFPLRLVRLYEKDFDEPDLEPDELQGMRPSDLEILAGNAAELGQISEAAYYLRRAGARRKVAKVVMATALTSFKRGLQANIVDYVRWIGNSADETTLTHAADLANTIETVNTVTTQTTQLIRRNSLRREKLLDRLF